MKRRFLLLMLALILFVSLAAILISRVSTQRTIERLIMQSAENRFSIIVMGFGASSSDVDLYSFVNFEHELLTVKSGEVPILQYGTARIDPASPSLRRFEREAWGYRFTLSVDFRAAVDESLYPVRMTIFIIAAVYAVLFGIFGWIFVGMVVGPVSRMAETIERITSRNLRVRLPVPRRKDELSRLVLTFNAMLDDISSTYERQVQLVEDLTHDIATPVQIMEGFRQMIERHGENSDLVREYLETSRLQLARLRNMTGLLRDSIAAERVRRMEKANASMITANNLSYYRQLHPDLAFHGEIAPGVSLGIAPEDLERIENILLDNAVKYGRAGRRIEVRLKPLEFSVRDFGPGIPAAEREAVFRRYHRSPEADAMGPGSGIGLAILKRFSEEYNFRIELASEPGKGSLFTLHFRDPSPSR